MAYPRTSTQSSYGDSDLVDNSVKNDYNGNYGSSHGYTGVNYGKNPTYASVASFTETDWDDREVKPNGVIFRGSEVTVGMIRDGTSNTYLMGEKMMDTNHYTDGQDGGDDGSGYDAVCADNLRASTACPLQDRSGYGNCNIFGASHAGAFGMVMCDGSVQRISYQIDLKTHQDLGQRNDGRIASIVQ